MKIRLETYVRLWYDVYTLIDDWGARICTHTLKVNWPMSERTALY